MRGTVRSSGRLWWGPSFRVPAPISTRSTTANRDAAGYARLVREIAARYRDRPHLTAIEIENEPDLTCMKNPSLSVDEGAGYFARFLRAGAAAARQGAHHALCDLSGVGLVVAAAGEAAGAISPEAG